MPLMRRKRVLLAAIESTPGTAESLDAGDGVFNIYAPDTQPEISFEPREGQGVFSSLPGVTGPYGGRCRFELDVFGGASMPAWASTFLPACGLQLSTATWKPETRPPEASGSGAETLTIGSYEDGIFKQLHGCMGTLTLRCRPGWPIRAIFEFQGIWTDPSNVALPAPDYPSVMPPRFASSSLVVGSFLPKISEMEIALNNEIAMREDPATVSGYHSAVIGGRRIGGRFDPESSLTGTHAAAVYNPHADFTAGTQRALSFTIGTAGNRIALSIPKLQISAPPQTGDRGGTQIDTIEFQANRNADAGDDELSITID